MNKTIGLIGALLTSTLLGACGGGGGGGATVSASTGSDSSGNLGSSGSINVGNNNGNGSGNSGPVQLASAEGIYEGSISNGRSNLTLILENDQYYSIYGRTLNGLFLVEGLVQGNGTSSNGSYTSSDLRDFYINDTPITGTLTASYVPAVRISGSTTENNVTVTFTGQALSLSNYLYNSAPSLANITGNWSLNTLDGRLVSVSIANTGAFTGSSDGCAYSGTIAPRSSGKNVFDVNVSYGPAPCALAGQTVSGIAVDFVTGNGKRQLVVATVNPSRSNAVVLIGQR